MNHGGKKMQNTPEEMEEYLSDKDNRLDFVMKLRDKCSEKTGIPMPDTIVKNIVEFSFLWGEVIKDPLLLEILPGFIFAWMDEQNQNRVLNKLKEWVPNELSKG
jgi:hypothetical protein